MTEQRGTIYPRPKGSAGPVLLVGALVALTILVINICVYGLANRACREAGGHMAIYHDGHLGWVCLAPKPAPAPVERER